MHVIAFPGWDFAQHPVAGTSAWDRMLRGLSGYEVSELGDQKGPALIIAGLFPVLPQADLARFLSEAKKQGHLIWSASNTNSAALIYTTDGAAGYERFKNGSAFPEFKADGDLLHLDSMEPFGHISETAFRINAAAAAQSGVCLPAPNQTYIEDDVVFGEGCYVEPNAYIERGVTLGNGVRIGLGARLSNVTVGDHSFIKPYSVIDAAEIGSGAAVGPFAHIRPGSKLGNDVRVGNFVETKNTHLGNSSKASHLTYLGDARIGQDCNIGAGTITCNYDGYNKNLTQLGDGVFIGSNSQLVAPTDLADGAYVAAGSTVTGSIPENALVIARSRQVVKEGRATLVRNTAKAKKEAKKKSS